MCIRDRRKARVKTAAMLAAASTARTAAVRSARGRACGADAGVGTADVEDSATVWRMMGLPKGTFVR